MGHPVTVREAVFDRAGAFVLVVEDLLGFKQARFLEMAADRGDGRDGYDDACSDRLAQGPIRCQSPRCRTIHLAVRLP